MVLSSIVSADQTTAMADVFKQGILEASGGMMSILLLGVVIY